MVCSTRRMLLLPTSALGGWSLSARAAGRLIACAWLLAVVLIYFKPSLLPGLKAFFWLPGTPTARGVFASIGHLIAAAADFVAAWGIGKTLGLLAQRTGRLAPAIEAPLLLFTTVSALGLGALAPGAGADRLAPSRRPLGNHFRRGRRGGAPCATATSPSATDAAGWRGVGGSGADRCLRGIR
jgi:hypothetical protein